MLLLHFLDFIAWAVVWFLAVTHVRKAKTQQLPVRTAIADLVVVAIAYTLPWICAALHGAAVLEDFAQWLVH